MRTTCRHCNKEYTTVIGKVCYYSDYPGNHGYVYGECSECGLDSGLDREAPEICSKIEKGSNGNITNISQNGGKGYVIVEIEESGISKELTHVQSFYCGECKGYDTSGKRHVLEKREVSHSFPKEATCTKDSAECVCGYVQKKLGHKVPEAKYDYINVNRHRKKYICERCGENLTSMFILEPHTLETVGSYAQEGTGILMEKVECTVCKGSWDYACTDPETGKYIYSNGSGGRKRKWRSEAEAGGGSRTEVAVGSGSSSRHR